MSPPEKKCSFNGALKGANDSLCKPSDARIFKYNIDVSKKSEIIYLCTENGQHVEYSKNEIS